MAEGRYDDLVRDLATLGRGIDPPAPSEGLTTAVMDRVAALPAPDRPANAWTRMWRQAGRRVADSVESRRRRVALVVVAVLLALLATPPVRAAVADWFGFGGVLVERGSPGPVPRRRRRRWRRTGRCRRPRPRSTSRCRCRRSSARPTGSRSRPTGGSCR